MEELDNFRGATLHRSLTGRGGSKQRIALHRKLAFSHADTKTAAAMGLSKGVSLRVFQQTAQPERPEGPENGAATVKIFQTESAGPVDSPHHRALAFEFMHRRISHPNARQGEARQG